MNEEIDRLKTELDQAEREFKTQTYLLQKREHVDVAMDQLEENTKLPLKEKQDLLKEMKQKRQQIDTQLDSIDEEIETKVYSLRTRLTEKTLDLYPDRKDGYSLLSSQIESIRREKLLLQEIAFQLAHLQSILSRTLKARQKIQRLGLLSYIFGENPTRIISNHLKNAEAQAKLLMELIQKEGMQEAELLQFLTSLQAESAKQWGFKHIDTTISSADKNLSTFLETYEELVLEKIEQLQEKEEEREKSLFT